MAFAVRDIARADSALVARLAAGELGLDIYGMRDKLHEAGLVHVDSETDLP
jgi:hypothetical protein